MFNKTISGTDVFYTKPGMLLELMEDQVASYFLDSRRCRLSNAPVKGDILMVLGAHVNQRYHSHGREVDDYVHVDFLWKDKKICFQYTIPDGSMIKYFSIKLTPSD